MASQLRLRRGTTAQHSTFTGASGEVTVDTTKKTLVVHDGTTAGGIPLVPVTDVSTSGGNSKILSTNASGNLGLGVTPSAWGGGFIGFQIKNSMSLWSGTGSAAYYSNNVYYDGTSRKYVSSATAAEYEQGGGIHSWKTAASGTAGNAITFTQAMTLDASSNLMVNRTSVLTNSQVSVDGSLGLNGASGNGVLRLYTAGTQYGGIASGAWAFGGSYSSTDLCLLASNSMIFGTNGSERARIDSSGNLLVGRTSQLDFGKLCLSYSGSSYNGIVFDDTLVVGTTSACVFKRSGTNVGAINTTATTTSYVTSSDYRLKENIQPMQNALAAVAQLNPVTYNWKADGSEGQGFIAHELQAVVPDAVVGEKDAVETYTDKEGNEQTRPVYQGIDTSFLVATLTAAIQELNAKVEAQAAEITLLKQGGV